MVCYKERNLSFCTLYGVWGDDFHKNFQILEKKIDFVLFHWFFKCFYCSINLKRQSEHSGLRFDTSSLVVIVSDENLSIIKKCWLQRWIMFNTRANCDTRPRSRTLNCKYWIPILNIKRWIQNTGLTWWYLFRTPSSHPKNISMIWTHDPKYWNSNTKSQILNLKNWTPNLDLICDFWINLIQFSEYSNILFVALVLQLERN